MINVWLKLLQKHLVSTLHKFHKITSNSNATYNFKETNDKYIVVSLLKMFSKITALRKLFKDSNSNTEQLIEQNLRS